ncbi:LOW QUALITY PROTEIN: AP-4 complex accessory subunit tepsin [Apus apus]|uniref:LOW QUALITY PROTEIN: AP-4 complex accessory subunit tepsin n=1 Tax=Apus apus TaxID=8895 RepID=UPI0021F835FE|nr:LOW QUALITY PROTEIN: AP-4 complex accessory subunit tepsin [Apus apus]
MAAPLRDRLGFLSRLPVLLRATADDDVPCPGYLLEEIAKISQESPGSCQCLLECLLGRLRSSSCRVKLKVLKILLHTCAQGCPQFVQQLKRNAGFVREAAAFSGPPDPLHGNSLNQKVRAAAQDLASLLFSDVPLTPPAALPARPVPPAGMGSSPSPGGSLQGFGFSSEKSSSGSAGEALLSTIQRAAEVVAQAVLPCPEGPRPLRGELLQDSYQPVRAPSPTRSLAGTMKPPAATTAHSTRVSHQPGLAGGGWEEVDSGHSSQDSSQGNGDLSRTSDSCSKSGSDSHSGASRELSQVAERGDADSPGDCVREVSLVSALTRGPRVFLTREEAQHFIKECGLLNCEVVLELLSRALQDPSDSVRMRSMGAISSLGCSDLLPLDQIFAVTRRQLQQLSRGSPGPVANRATKLLRQLEALCSHQSSPGSSRLGSHLAVGSAPGPGDLLTDTPPPAGHSVLTPLSPAPRPAATPGQETPGGPGAAVPAWPREPEVARGLAGAPAPSLSLFAGMELVARPGAVPGLESPPGKPQPLPRRQDGQGGPGGSPQSSAFAFLNV